MNEVRPLFPEQRLASNTGASIWVNANAGSGKTFVLASRVLRLLLDGNDPATLLCLTFTCAAAAEMANRVLDTLRLWATIDDDALSDHLFALQGARPTPRQTERARSLFALALETPGGLKIQTIHAFCEAVLARFPFEAGVPPNPTILDDRLISELLEAARQGVLNDAAREPSSELGNALQKLIADVEETQLSLRLSEALSKRGMLQSWVSAHGGLKPALAGLRRQLALGQDDNEAGVGEALSEAGSIFAGEGAAIIEALLASSKRDAGTGERLSDALKPSATADEMFAFALKASDELPRSPSTFVTKGWRENHPHFAEKIDEYAERLVAVRETYNAIGEYDRTAALIAITFAVLDRYTALKVARGALDFEDLIEKTADLLTTDVGAAWVLYKLDQGIDHILVDEAQDTSAAQWRIIQSLAEEFYSGESARKKPRTVFVVGDEKQSIFSFQGADPTVFSAMQRAFRTRIQGAQQAFERVPLLTSFRTVPSVLGAVDRIFDTMDPEAGVVSVGDVWPGHQPIRQASDGGVVELWPVIDAEEVEDPRPWDAPLDTPLPGDPKAQNAERIAAFVAHILTENETAGPDGAPIAPGDILVLVRKRQTFADAINRALKRRDIPVTGADRLRLNEQIAVMDLTALMNFVLLPEDDLTLASLLKSPLCGLNDDDLIEIAPNRTGTLWQAVRGAEAYQPVSDKLSSWLARADQVTPFNFFAEVLSNDGGRRAFRARLGAEVEDILDEFLALAERFEQEQSPSLQGFAAFMETVDVVLKRDMDQASDHVRVMTVHGAKGLEARVVILADAAGVTDGKQDPALTPLDTDGQAQPLLWIKGKGTRSKSAENAKLAQARRREAEDRRLLYVALTRACDRLYIAGHGDGRRRGQGAPPGSWHGVVDTALETEWRTVTDPYGLGFDVKRIGTPTRAAGSELRAIEEDRAAPDWLWHAAPPDRVKSRLAAPATAWLADANDPPPPLDMMEPVQETSRALVRGRVIHKLLQWLPLERPENWAEKIDGVTSRHGFAKSEISQTASEVISILNDPRLTAVFGPGSRAEVPMIGTIMRPDGEEVIVSGIIDRLCVEPNRVTLVDFKTGGGSVEPFLAQPAHITQTQAYRALLHNLYPDRAIVAVLVYTSGPTIIPVESA
ncbi:MAG: double-strand break repair helicase AddA [Pseudomonadota bacterium]